MKQHPAAMIVQYYRYAPGRMDCTWAYLIASERLGMWPGYPNECQWMVPDR